MTAALGERHCGLPTTALSSNHSAGVHGTSSNPNQHSFDVVCRRVHCRGGGTCWPVWARGIPVEGWSSQGVENVRRDRNNVELLTQDDYMRGTVHLGGKKCNKGQEPEARLRWCGRVSRRSLAVERCWGWNWQADSMDAWRKTKAEIYGCAVRERTTLIFTRMELDLDQMICCDFFV